MISGPIIFVFHPASFEGFYVNLSFALSSIGINILITVFVIDKLIKYRREQQWTKVRNVTLSAILAHLCDIAAEIYVEFAIPSVGLTSIDRILQGRNKLNAATPQAFDEFAVQLSKIHQDIRNRSPSTVVIEFYRKIRWDLDQIQHVLTPLMLTSSSDQTLIDALIAFDQNHREFCNSIRSHQMAGTQAAFPALVSLVKCSGKLYATVADLSAPRFQ